MASFTLDCYIPNQFSERVSRVYSENTMLLLPESKRMEFVLIDKSTETSVQEVDGESRLVFQLRGDALENGKEGYTANDLISSSILYLLITIEYDLELEDGTFLRIEDLPPLTVTRFAITAQSGVAEKLASVEELETINNLLSV